MRAVLPGSLQSEQSGFCFLEKCEHCLTIYLKEEVSSGGFIQFAFRKRKPQGGPEIKCFCNLFIDFYLFI